MTTNVVQGVPHPGPGLSHHDVSSPFDGMLATRHLAQGALVRTEFIQQTRRDRHVPFQDVNDQLAEGIDLIGIGVL